MEKELDKTNPNWWLRTRNWRDFTNVYHEGYNPLDLPEEELEEGATVFKEALFGFLEEYQGFAQTIDNQTAQDEVRKQLDCWLPLAPIRLIEWLVELKEKAADYCPRHSLRHTILENGLTQISECMICGKRWRTMTTKNDGKWIKTIMRDS